MLFRWMGVHAAWPHFLVLCLVFEGMKSGGGWAGGCWQGGAGQAHHWPLTGPSHLINDPWVRYCGVWGSCIWTSNTYRGTKVCVCKLYLSLCVYVCVGVFVCKCGMECIARKVTTYQPPLSSSFSLSQMGYSGDGPDRPWFGFWFMFLWSSNQRFHLLLLYGSWDDEWCSLSVKPSLCVFAPHFNC